MRLSREQVALPWTAPPQSLQTSDPVPLAKFTAAFLSADHLHSGDRIHEYELQDASRQRTRRTRRNRRTRQTRPFHAHGSGEFDEFGGFSGSTDSADSTGTEFQSNISLYLTYPERGEAKDEKHTNKISPITTRKSILTFPPLRSLRTHSGFLPPGNDCTKSDSNFNVSSLTSATCGCVFPFTRKVNQVKHI